MRAGSLRHRLIIESYTEAQDALGQPVPTWSTFATVWGRVAPMTAGESYEAAQNVARVNHEVIIRAGIALAEKMRINHSGKYLYVQGIRNEDGRGIALMLECSEVA